MHMKRLQQPQHGKALTRIKGLLGIVLLSTATFGAAAVFRPTTAAYVDLSRYDGKWYTITSLPAWFESGCTGSTTDYTLQKDGQLKVVNRCHKGSLDGPVKSFEGKAWVVDRSSNSKMKVRFGWFITSDYWIFDVSPDYKHCVIGTPNGRYLWIMSRAPAMDEATYGNLVANGFDTSRLETTLQSEKTRKTRE